MKPTVSNPDRPDDGMLPAPPAPLTPPSQPRRPPPPPPPKPSKEKREKIRALLVAELTATNTPVITDPRPSSPGTNDAVLPPPNNHLQSPFHDIDSVPAFPDIPDEMFSMGTLSSPEFLPPPPDMMFTDSSTSSSASSSTEDLRKEVEFPELPDCVEESASDDDDDIDFTDADLAIDKMLDELQDFSRELSHEDKSEIPTTPIIDEEKFDLLRIQSIANVEDSEEVDLDALLEDLCAMEQGMNEEKAQLQKEGKKVSFKNKNDIVVIPHVGKTESMKENDHKTIQQQHSGGDEKGYSEKSKVGRTTSLTHDVLERLESLQTEMESEDLSEEDREAKLKAEKIKIALEKMKAASLQELFIKVYNSEQRTNKTMMIDHAWTTRKVTDRMINKDNVEPNANWCIVEKLPDLSMERILEDSEFLLQTVLDWGRNSENRLAFVNRRDKYTLFRNPQNFLLTSVDTKGDAHLAKSSKDVLLHEFFGKDQTRTPTTEGFLWLQEGRKKWVKHFFSLRASGIYYTPKGKQKGGDMVCLTSMDHNNVYRCLGFRRKFSAPTDHVFCIKHPKVQTFKSKYVYCICAETEKAKEIWIQLIRMAKYGYKMYEDYLVTQQELESLLLGPNNHSTMANGTMTSSELVAASAERTNMLKKDQNNGVRVMGRQNVLGTIFSTAWTKGDARIQRAKNMSSQTVSTSSSSSDEFD